MIPATQHTGQKLRCVPAKGLICSWSETIYRVPVPAQQTPPMPIEEEFSMFHRLQFWKRLSIVLMIGDLALAVFVNVALKQSKPPPTKPPQFRDGPSVEIYRLPQKSSWTHV